MAAGVRFTLPGWLYFAGSPEEIPEPGGDGGVFPGLPGWLGYAAAPEGAATLPNIGTVTACRHQTVVTVTGTNFGATTGGIAIAGFAQTVVTWTDTQVTFNCNRGNLTYGPKSLRLTTSGGLETTASVTLLPQNTDWDYLTLTTLTDPAYRITAVPDLAAGDQISFGNVQGALLSGLEVRPDGSFRIVEGATSFTAEVNDGTGWGTPGTQVLQETTGNYLTLNDGGTWKQLDYPSVHHNGEWVNPLSGWIRHNGVWEKFYPVQEENPIVQLLTPGDGDTIKNDVVLQAAAVDDGDIVRLDFQLQVSDQIFNLGTFTGPPYRLTVNTESSPFIGNGTYTIIASAQDDGGNYGSDEATVYVTNNLPPTCVITNPTEGEEVWGSLTVGVSATDSDGSIAGVSLYEDGVLVSEDTSSPYNWTINTLSKSNGLHTYQAVAEDNEAALTSSLPVTVTINNIPTPTLTSISAYILKWVLYYNISSNLANGNIYMIWTQTPAVPSPQAIRAGLDGYGVPADDARTYAANHVGTYTYSKSITPSAGQWYVFWVQENEHGAFSNVVSQNILQLPLLSVSVSPSLVSGSGTAPIGGTSTVTTTVATATPANAIGAVTYVWEWVSGDQFIILNQGGSQTAFRKSSTVDAVYSGTYRVRVSDSAGNSAISPNFTVRTTHTFIDF